MMKPCPKCGQMGHDGRRHNKGRPVGTVATPAERVMLKRWSASAWRKATGVTSDPVTEADWSELDDIK